MSRVTEFRDESERNVDAPTTTLLLNLSQNWNNASRLLLLGVHYNSLPYMAITISLAVTCVLYGNGRSHIPNVFCTISQFPLLWSNPQLLLLLLLLLLLVLFVVAGT